MFYTVVGASCALVMERWPFFFPRSDFFSQGKSLVDLELAGKKKIGKISRSLPSTTKKTMSSHAMSKRCANALDTHKWEKGTPNQEGCDAASKWEKMTCRACGTSFLHFYDIFHDPLQSAMTFHVNVVCDKASAAERIAADARYAEACSSEKATAAVATIESKEKKTKKRSRSRSQSPPRDSNTQRQRTDEPVAVLLAPPDEMEKREAANTQSRILAIVQLITRAMTSGRYALGGGNTYHIMIDPNDEHFQRAHSGPLTPKTLKAAAKYLERCQAAISTPKTIEDYEREDVPKIETPVVQHWDVEWEVQIAPSPASRLWLGTKTTNIHSWSWPVESIITHPVRISLSRPYNYKI